jgi:hypothetical protein
MNSATPATLKRLVNSSVLYIVISIIAGIFAVQANLPAQPMGEGSGSGKPVLQDFLFGGGTAMSPGIPWLIAQVILTALTFRKNSLGTVGVLGLSFHALLSGIFSVTEPNFQKVFNLETFNIFKVILQLGVTVTPFVITVFGILEWRSRHQK